MKKYIGFDIGGTKCACVIGDENGNVLAKSKFATEPCRGWQAVVDELCDCALRLISDNSLSPADISAGGVSCGGPLSSKSGVIMCPPNLPDWDNVPICDILQSRFGFPVFLQNDANACALAEWQFGAGRGFDNIVFLTFGTGMGAGLILNGRLYAGTNDMAGEVGHIRIEKSGPVGYGKEGSFEGFCSGGGIAGLAAAVIEEYAQKGIETSVPCNDITAKSVASAAQSGDPVAKEIYSLCGEKLGAALAVLVDVLNPQRIIIGSIYERSEMLLRDSMLRTLKAEALPISLSCCEIVPAELGDGIGDYAALGVARFGGCK